MQSPFFQHYDPDLEAVLATMGSLDEVADIQAALQVPPAPIPVPASFSAGGWAMASRMPARHPARVLMEAATQDPVGVMANIMLHDARAGRDTTEQRLRVVFSAAEIATHSHEAQALAVKAMAGIKAAQTTLAPTAKGVSVALADEMELGA